MGEDFTIWGGVPVNDLGIGHLRNIIRDGYRNPIIVKRAKKEGIPVIRIPEITSDGIGMFIEATASVLLVDPNNDQARYIIELYETSTASELCKTSRPSELYVEYSMYTNRIEFEKEERKQKAGICNNCNEVYEKNISTIDGNKICKICINNKK